MDLEQSRPALSESRVCLLLACQVAPAGFNDPPGLSPLVIRKISLHHAAGSFCDLKMLVSFCMRVLVCSHLGTVCTPVYASAHASALACYGQTRAAVASFPQYPAKSRDASVITGATSFNSYTQLFDVSPRDLKSWPHVCPTRVLTH